MAPQVLASIRVLFQPAEQGRALGLYHGADAAPGLIASVIGSVVLLAGYRVVVGRRMT